MPGIVERLWVFVSRHDDAMRALEASHEKRFFGSKVTVSVHEGVGTSSLTAVLMIWINVTLSLIHI